MLDDLPNGPQIYVPLLALLQRKAESFAFRFSCFSVNSIVYSIYFIYMYIDDFLSVCVIFHMFADRQKQRQDKCFLFQKGKRV